MFFKIKEIYNLSYDVHGDSGLSDWYNRLIDKTIDEIDIYDTGKMMRQSILPELAKKMLIKLFIKNPFDGETYSGEVLEKLIMYSIDYIDSEERHTINDIIGHFKSINITENDLDPEDKDMFIKNICVLEKMLAQ